MEVLLLHVVNDVRYRPLEEARNVGVAAGKLEDTEALVNEVRGLLLGLRETVLDAVFIPKLKEFRVAQHLLDSLLLYPSQWSTAWLRLRAELLLRLREEVGSCGRSDT